VKMKCSLPDLENECQWSVNNCWPSNMINYNTMWPLLSIYVVLAVLGREKAHKYLVVAV